MKLVSILSALALVLGLTTESKAFGRLFSRSKNVERVVVKQQVVKQNVVKVQQVQVKQVNVVEQVKVQRVVVQPVYAVQSYSYYPQAVQIQPVQAYYSVQSVQSYGYGGSLNLTGGCAQNQQQIQALQLQVRQLQQAELQRLEAERQRLIQPMNPPK